MKSQLFFKDHYILTLTTKCNQDCLFCLVNKKSATDLSYKDAILQLKKAREQGATKLSIDGGEPTLLPYFNKLIKQSFSLGFKKIAIKTNGLKFSDYTFAQSVIEGNETAIDIYLSLHGPNAFIHNKLAQTQDSFEGAIKAAKNIIKLQGNIISNIVINNFNFLFLKEYLDLLQKIGIRETLFLFILSKGNALKNKFLIPDIKDVIPFVKEAIDYANSKDIYVGLSFFPFCSLDSYYINYSVEFHMLNSVNIFDKDYKEIYKSKDCRKCKYFLQCPGVRKEYYKLKGFQFKPIK